MFDPKYESKIACQNSILYFPVNEPAEKGMQFAGKSLDYNKLSEDKQEMKSIFVYAPMRGQNKIILGIATTLSQSTNLFFATKGLRTKTFRAKCDSSL